MCENYIKSSITGFVVGDALGVPVEFSSREKMKMSPLKEMKGYGTHNQPIGTWSDDSSMMLATADSIIAEKKINNEDIMERYCDWAKNANYTATDCVFDMGITTSNAIRRFLRGGIPAEECGDSGFRNNGNGSLMRTLPLALYLIYANIEENEKTSIINKFSSITHSHEISKLGCNIYCDFINELIKNNLDKEKALSKMQQKDYSSEFSEEAILQYQSILTGSVKEKKESEIRGSGYVVNTLEASIWSLMNSNSYEETVLKAINLGEDTDTVGAIAGSLAGLTYGYENIPKKWIENLKKKEYVEKMATDFSHTLEEIQFTAPKGVDSIKNRQI